MVSVDGWNERVQRGPPSCCGREGGGALGHRGEVEAHGVPLGVDDARHRFDRGPVRGRGRGRGYDAGCADLGCAEGIRLRQLDGRRGAGPVVRGHLLGSRHGAMRQLCERHLCGAERLGLSLPAAIGSYVPARLRCVRRGDGPRRRGFSRQHAILVDLEGCAVVGGGDVRPHPRLDRRRHIGGAVGEVVVQLAGGIVLQPLAASLPAGEDVGVAGAGFRRELHEQLGGGGGCQLGEVLGREVVAEGGRRAVEDGHLAAEFLHGLERRAAERSQDMRRLGEVGGGPLREVDGQQRRCRDGLASGGGEDNLADERFLLPGVARVGFQAVGAFGGERGAEQRAHELGGLVGGGVVVVGHVAGVVRLGPLGVQHHDAIAHHHVVGQSRRVGPDLVGGDGERRPGLRDGVGRYAHGRALLQNRGKAARLHGGVRVRPGGLVGHLERPGGSQIGSLAEVHAPDGDLVSVGGVHLDQQALACIVAVGRVSARAAVLVVAVGILAAAHPEAIAEGGRLHEREPVDVLEDGARVLLGDVRVPGEVDELRVLRLELVVERFGIAVVHRAVIADPAGVERRGGVPDGVGEGMVRHEEDGLGARGVVGCGGGDLALHPIEDGDGRRAVVVIGGVAVPVAPPAAGGDHVVAAYFGMDVQLALEGAAWFLIGIRAGQVREEVLEVRHGVALEGAAAYAELVVAHDEQGRLPDGGVRSRQKRVELGGRAGVHRVAREDVRGAVGYGLVDGLEGERQLLLHVAAGEMSVAVHREAHFAGGELGPAGVFGLGEGRVGVLAGECEHAAHGRHPAGGGQFHERAARYAERAVVVDRGELGIHDVLSVDCARCVAVAPHARSPPGVGALYRRRAR